MARESRGGLVIIYVNVDSNVALVSNISTKVLYIKIIITHMQAEKHEEDVS